MWHVAYSSGLEDIGVVLVGKEDVAFEGRAFILES
jgi:hypothetical protein